MFKAIRIRWYAHLLRSRESAERSEAALKLVQTGDRRAVEALIKVLGDSSVRESAAEALGKLSDARAVEPLIEALGDGDKVVRRAVADALGKLGDARAVEPLVNALEHRDKEVRRTAARALATLCRQNPSCLRYRWMTVHNLVTEPHHDHHYDRSPTPCSHYDDPHEDRGIGLEFPDPPVGYTGDSKGDTGTDARPDF